MVVVVDKDAVFQGALERELDGLSIPLRGLAAARRLMRTVRPSAIIVGHGLLAGDPVRHMQALARASPIVVMLPEWDAALARDLYWDGAAVVVERRSPALVAELALRAASACRVAAARARRQERGSPSAATRAQAPARARR